MFEQEIANWQQTLPNQLPGSFSAYKDGQTDRVSAFSIDADDTALRDLLSSNPDHLRINIGLKQQGAITVIGTAPNVQFYLQGIHKDPLSKVAQAQASKMVALNWDPNPPFLTEGFLGPDSGVDEIPSEGAMLFLMGWLETAFEDIGNAFDGLNSKTNQIQRVKHYTFSSEESLKIFDLLKQNPAKTKLYLYLGKSIPVSAHPMGFRPVVEVRISDSSISARSTSGGGGSHFFDFSNPCPPAC